MMNDRARLWSKRKSAPFADPRDEERALREMRKSIDHSFNFNIDFKGEQPYMDNYRATVSFGAGCWQNTGTRRRADVPQQQERQHSILVSRQGLHSGLAMLVVAVCLFVMGGTCSRRFRTSAPRLVSGRRTSTRSSRRMIPCRRKSASRRRNSRFCSGRRNWG